MSQLILGFLRLYRYCLSPLLGQCCRFYPSCSQYAIDAIQSDGLWRGSYRSMRRLLCCHPWYREK